MLLGDTSTPPAEVAETPTPAPKTIKVSDLLEMGAAFILHPDGRATATLPEGQVIGDKQAPKLVEIYQRSVLHTLKELSRNGASKDSEITPERALALLERFADNQHQAHAYNDGPTLSRTRLFCNALHACLYRLGVSDEAINAARNMPHIDQDFPTMKSALGREVTHVQGDAWIPLWKSFEGRVDAEADHVAPVIHRTEAELKEERLAQIKAVHLRMLREQAAAADAGEETPTPVAEDAGSHAPDDNAQHMNVIELKTAHRDALDAYEAVWAEIRHKIEPRHSIAELTGSGSKKPYMLLKHQDFLAAFETMLDTAQELGITRGRADVDAPHTKGSMVDLLGSLKRAHYDLDTSRNALKQFEDERSATR